MLERKMRPLFTLRNFLDESNRIEGIVGVRHDLIIASEAFLSCAEIGVQDLINFVKIAQPGAVLRDSVGLNVRVGDHFAPPGGPAILADLQLILKVATSGQYDPYFVHVMYETLHPFTDGNGRSGRILWLWMMGGIERAPLGFLHSFYYQALRHSRIHRRESAPFNGPDLDEPDGAA